ncbi:MAG: putative glucose/L-sorbosone dehydrogenase, distantly related to bacterial beta-galactosidase, partial [Chthonomonadaceae bacterium]|nr:putative glucose/L-sorbosone dehydrogenase, distantly related to bacterial beta-galactosidase [Chthonomonadaceae bacterium]
SDGRFFADGNFTVRGPAGATKILLRSGPEYVPLTLEVTAKIGQRQRLRAHLARWFSTVERGWYGGESHVHTKHDSSGEVQNDGAYTALQARAQGLSFLSQASKGSGDEDPTPLSTPDFLFRNAFELGGGPFIGHITTPGITQQLANTTYNAAYAGTLPIQHLLDPIHALGGVIVYTHPLAPPTQLHWMGATEVYSDAVLGRCADLFDIDSRATKMVWFSLLNLGNRIAASSYTDSALERAGSTSPGDRRLYCHAREFSYKAIIDGMRNGHTFATNGGPVFPFFTVNGHEPGDLLPLPGDHQAKAHIEIHTLYPLKSVEVYRKGNLAHAFPVSGQKGAVTLDYRFAESEPSWYVLRAEDDHGNWAITSPVYFGDLKPAARHAGVVLFEISNHTHMVELRRSFFAHLLVTVAPEDPLTEVVILKDGQPLQRFAPGGGDHVVAGQTPVTGRDGEYAPGWIWSRVQNRAVHFQADWPVLETGWYSVEAQTASGKTIRTDACRFDATNPNSRQLSLAQLTAEQVRLTRWGYAEEMPLADIHVPFEGDHWWYPTRQFWNVKATFDGQSHEVGGGDPKWAQTNFRVKGG